MKLSLIDTDILSFMLKKDKTVLENIEKYLKEFNRLNISAITYYEALSGLKYIGATDKLARLEYLVKHNNVIGIDEEAIQTAADIYVYLRQRGELLSQADILIAGIAKSKSLVLVTNNVAHFERIPGLVVENWSIIH